MRYKVLFLVHEQYGCRNLCLAHPQDITFTKTKEVLLMFVKNLLKTMQRLYFLKLVASIKFKTQVIKFRILLNKLEIIISEAQMQISGDKFSDQSAHFHLQFKFGFTFIPHRIVLLCTNAAFYSHIAHITCSDQYRVHGSIP